MTILLARGDLLFCYLRMFPADATPPDKILVSACLAGLPCSHDGRARRSEAVAALVGSGATVPVCPEQLGGMPSPRETAEIAGGDGGGVIDGSARVVSRSGKDLTAAFKEGARQTLAVARRHGCRRAVLKARSPSCGHGRIYDGSFSGGIKPGDGVAAALLMRSGIEIVTEENLEQISHWTNEHGT